MQLTDDRRIQAAWQRFSESLDRIRPAPVPDHQ